MCTEYSFVVFLEGFYLCSLVFCVKLAKRQLVQTSIFMYDIDKFVKMVSHYMNDLAARKSEKNPEVM